MTGFDLAKFILPYFVEGLLIGNRVILDWNLSGHSSHGVNAALVTCLDEKIHIGLQKCLIHGDFGAIGKDHVGPMSELFDVTENVVPAAAVKPGRMIAELI